MTSALKAPAKINIGLRVFLKRKDGYHNIETIFYPVRIFDIVKVEIKKLNGKNKISVVTNSPELKDEKMNICYKAVKLFFKEFRISGYQIKIYIKKNIPIGAGLGGGSSDAAAVLMLLYKYFLSQKSGIASSLRSSQIKQLAIKLGSDVAYFVNHKLQITNYELQPAYATGKGEILNPLPNFKINNPILIVYPGINVSTKWAYNQFKVQNSKFKVLSKINAFSFKRINLFKNDFENAVFDKYPEIKAIKERMYEYGALFSSMSGSGSAVYGIFKTLSELTRLIKFFKRKGYEVYKG